MIHIDPSGSLSYISWKQLVHFFLNMSTRMGVWLLAFALCLAVGEPSRADVESTPAASVAPLRRAHAHNDYRHARPLLDALDNGFCSVEADVFLVDGELRIGHDRNELRPGRTLQSLYLEPLRWRIRRGSVYDSPARFILLVDIKADGEKVYQVLQRVLPQYRTILSSYERGRVYGRAITVILSGNRPRAMLESETTRYAFLDGRLSDLEADKSRAPAALMPLVSDNYRLHFRWDGRGAMPEEERQNLRAMTQKAHARGHLLRLWATPETPTAWGELLDAGMDLINTDDLEGLRRFLLR